MRVKICGITRPGDIEACERARVDAIGLVFAADSRRRVTPERAREIVAAASPLLTIVGVFRDQEPELVIDHASLVGLDAVQVHDYDRGGIERLVSAGLRVIAAHGFSPGRDHAESLAWGASAVLVDGSVPGSGRSYDWQAARGMRGTGRLIIAGGLRPDNVALAVSTLRPWGVDVSSGVESEPGVKDAELIVRFSSAAREAAGETAA